LLAQPLLRPLLQEFFLAERISVVTAVGLEDLVSGIDLPDLFIFITIGIRMMALHQGPMSGLDLLQGRPPREGEDPYRLFQVLVFHPINSAFPLQKHLQDHL